jgi:hypothetical protein
MCRLVKQRKAFKFQTQQTAGREGAHPCQQAYQHRPKPTPEAAPCASP